MVKSGHTTLVVSYLNWLCTWLLFLFSCHHLPLFCTHAHLQNPGSNSVMLQSYAVGSRACPLERSCQHCFCCFICWIKVQSDMSNIWFVLWFTFLSATTNNCTPFLYSSSLISISTRNSYLSIIFTYLYFTCNMDSKLFRHWCNWTPHKFWITTHVTKEDNNQMVFKHQQ